MRTGKFRLGTDQLLVDAAGESYISLEDYAVAMIDSSSGQRIHVSDLLWAIEEQERAIMRVT